MKKYKKFVSILTVLCLILTLAPVTALAAPGGVTGPLDLTSRGSDKGEGWDWEWNSTNREGTLTLNGLYLVVTEEANGIILPDGDVKIVLIGDDNTIITTGEYADAIYGEKTNLTILGSGKLLTVTDCCGVYSEEGDIIISGSTIEIKADSHGIHTRGGGIAFENCNVDIKANNYSGLYAEEGDITIRNCEINIKSKGRGINTYEGDVIINNSKVNIDSGWNGISMWVDYKEEGNVIINDSAVNIEAEDNGICTWGGNVTINGGSVTANGILSGINAIGAYKGGALSGGKITFNGEMINITSEKVAVLSEVKYEGSKPSLSNLITYDSTKLNLVIVPSTGKQSKALSYTTDATDYKEAEIGFSFVADMDLISYNGKDWDGFCTEVYFREKSSFGDIVNHWAEDVIMDMSNKGIVNGYADGTFKPNNPITRAEYLTMMIKALGFEATAEELAEVVAFADVKRILEWAAEYVSIGRALGIVEGDVNGNFNPSSLITRQDMFVMTYRALLAMEVLEAFEGVAALNEFTDRGDIASYADEAGLSLVEKGLVKGSGGKLNPRKNATRGEAAQFLFNILGYITAASDAPAGDEGSAKVQVTAQVAFGRAIGPLNLTNRGSDKGEGWEWIWNAEDKEGTLTLNDLYLVVTGEENGIHLPDGDVKIVLVGDDNTILTTGDTADAIYGGKTNLTILGSGKLSTVAGCCGVFTLEGDIIASGSMIEIKADSHGIHAGKGNITIENCTVKIKLDRDGLFTEKGNIIIGNSKIDIVAKEEGVRAFEGDVIINNSVVNIDAGWSGIYAKMFYEEGGNVSINNSAVIIKAQNTGIATWLGNVAINGGNVVVDGWWYGIDVMGKYEGGVLSGGKVTFNGGMIGITSKDAAVISAIRYRGSKPTISNPITYDSTKLNLVTEPSGGKFSKALSYDTDYEGPGIVFSFVTDTDKTSCDWENWDEFCTEVYFREKTE